MDHRTSEMGHWSCEAEPCDTIGFSAGGPNWADAQGGGAAFGLRCQCFHRTRIRRPSTSSAATLREYADVAVLELSPTMSTSSPMNSRTCRPQPSMVLGGPQRLPWSLRRISLDTPRNAADRKGFVKRLASAPAELRRLSSGETWLAAIARIGLPAVIKTRRFGYYGKGPGDPR